MTAEEQERRANERRRQEAARIILENHTKKRSRDTDALLLFQDLRRQLIAQRGSARKPQGA
jgi:hypothetical protein